MQRVKISSIPRALKHSFHSVSHRKNVNMLGHSYSYPTRFSRNTCNLMLQQTTKNSLQRNSFYGKNFCLKRKKTVTSTPFFKNRVKEILTQNEDEPPYFQVIPKSVNYLPLISLLVLGDKVNPFITETVIIQKSGFYMITASVMKGLNKSSSSTNHLKILLFLPLAYIKSVYVYHEGYQEEIVLYVLYVVK